MSLKNKQIEFSICFAKLIVFAYEQGCELVIGDVARNALVFGSYGTSKGYGSASSNHKICLAGDLNLFVDSEYIISSEHPAWAVLHDYWLTLSEHSAPMIDGDANHFSFMHNGRY